MSVHAFVIESPGHRMVVDTCIGNDKRRGIPGWNICRCRFLADLAKAGFAPNRSTRVLCTHLHVDHVGWNTMLVDGTLGADLSARALPHSGGRNGSMVEDTASPTRANARRLGAPGVRGGARRPGRKRHRITDEIRLEPTPGHTPGHDSVRISSRGQEAVITGDLMHHPVQMAHPEWGSHFDSDFDAGDRDPARVPGALRRPADPGAGYAFRHAERGPNRARRQRLAARNLDAF